MSEKPDFADAIDEAIEAAFSVMHHDADRDMEPAQLEERTLRERLLPIAARIHADGERSMRERAVERFGGAHWKDAEIQDILRHLPIEAEEASDD